jgi:hypothetical protein
MPPSRRRAVPALAPPRPSREPGAGPARLLSLLLLTLLVAGAAAPATAQAAASSSPALPLLAPLSDGQQVPLPELDPALPSPSRHLGYPLGSRFTRHAEILRYLEALDAASDRVAMWRYGETYEHRPLVLLAISSERNIARLDEIRRGREALDQPHRFAGDDGARELAALPAVVWLGYGVHGDESSSAEAALAAAYVLAAGRGAGAPALDDTVVLLDPLVNPDGRERYVNGYLSRAGAVPDPHPDSREHAQAWPGGRGNHYAVDLNRDWAWATQVETRARVAEMGAWEPQVYVDFHEMTAESTYFFPPAAEPLHPAFDAATRRWFETFGRANAEAFDRLGWTYYVGEEFDLFYPAYGDTYPTLRGGLGMTYEVAGGGEAGSLVERAGSGRWSLADRLARHLATTIATVATASARSRELVKDFAARRREQAKGSGPTFVWPAGQPEGDWLASLLELHGVAVGRLRRDEPVEARPIAGGEPRRVELQAGSWAVATAQPLGALALALLEREAALPDGFLARQRDRAAAHLSPQFYDVTAWSLPLAANLEAWSTADGVGIAYDAPAAPEPFAGAGRVGYLLPPSGIAGYRFAAALLAHDVPFRLALEPLTVGGRQFPTGTLFVPRGGRPALEQELAPLARQLGIQLHGAESSLTSAGIPLGSERMVAVREPRVGLVAGRGVSATSFGSLWHLLDRDVALEHSVIDLADLADVDLGRFRVLVFPEGSYGRAVGEEERARLATWVKEGGVLVLLPGALGWAHDAELTRLAPRDLAHPSQEGDGEGTGATAPDSDRVWDTQLLVPGSIVATELSAHELAVGLPRPPPMLFWGDNFFDASGDPLVDLLRVRAHDPVVAGVAWPEAREQLSGAVLVATERQGRGRVVAFTQDPAFRLFWRGTMPLLLNAVLYGPSLG